MCFNVVQIVNLIFTRRFNVMCADSDFYFHFYFLDNVWIALMWPPRLTGRYKPIIYLSIYLASLWPDDGLTSSPDWTSVVEWSLKVNYLSMVNVFVSRILYTVTVEVRFAWQNSGPFSSGKPVVTESHYLALVLNAAQVYSVLPEQRFLLLGTRTALPV